ncbi:MAG: Ldh family oxidoreductase [Paracoccaceae bacterium]
MAAEDNYADLLIDAAKLTGFAEGFLLALGSPADIAAEVAAHLVESDLCGVHSHGCVRLPQYLGHARTGSFDPKASPTLTMAEGGGPLVDGRGGFGMPACRMATAEAASLARSQGAGAVGVANVGHTGRMGAFADQGAALGCLTFITGGGGRREWKQVAPYGGAKGALPTNPYSISVPAGDGGPVGFDFATSAAAAGKVLAAKSAGRALPEGLIIDSAGRPSTNPDDYNAGGAILPSAGAKGFGMALVAELIGEAVFPKAMGGMNWLIVCIDISRFRAPADYAAAAEETVAAVAATPPASGFDRVEIPGRREAALASARRKAGVPVPPATLALMKAAAAEIGASVADLP